MEKFIKYCIKPQISEVNSNYGKFVIKPLERGFGNTLGNALRRVLLSNIPSAAVFAIKIPNIDHNHEFQGIDGVKEDLTNIILNVKKLAVKVDQKIISEEDFDSYTIENWPVLTIDVNKKGQITAGDIVCPTGFEIVNKDLIICNKTSEETPFKMEIFVKHGRGFKFRKENHEIINSLSVIATDSDFSPIIQVKYFVEEIVQENVTDTLTIEIATNGSISAPDALSYASQILIEHFSPLADINEVISQERMMDNGESKNKRNLSISINELDLGVRPYNCLKNNGITTLQELAELTKNEVENIPNLGKKSLKDITAKLLEYGLSFKEE